MAPARAPRTELIEVRRSAVHGRGAFAVARIAKGTRLIEYLGERVSHAEADRRYETKAENDSHTFLFIVDRRTVIDAGVDGNDARFFNTSCDPNCESVIDRARVYIEAIRDIEPGEELTYDYQIYRDDDDPDDIDEVFACRCGAANCRGTMLWPPEPKPARRTRKKAKRSPPKSSKGRKRTRSAGSAPGKTSRRGSSSGRTGRAKRGGRRR